MISRLFQTGAFLVLLLGVLAFNPSVAQALSADEIRDLINQLQKQIEQLQKQLAETKPQAWCHTFNTNLRIGDVSGEIAALQIALQKEGLIGEEVSGKEFDEKIASAVVGFQERYRKQVLAPFGLARGTGFVGKSTRAKLNALYGCAGETLTLPPTPDAKAPIIDSVDGPTYLKAGEQGTWTIKARDPELGSLSYSVDWGNGEVLTGMTYATFIRQEGYSISGIYTIRFTVSDTQGLSATKSVAVNVTTEAQQNILPYNYDYNSYYYSNVPQPVSPSITVLSPNGGEQWTTGSVYNIAWNAKGLDAVTLWLADFSTSSIIWHRISADLSNLAVGKYSWKVGTCYGSICNFSAGDKYKIKVEESATSSRYPSLSNDESDNYFSIVSASSSFKTLEDQTASISDAVSRFLQSFEEFKKSNP